MDRENWEFSTSFEDYNRAFPFSVMLSVLIFTSLKGKDQISCQLTLKLEINIVVAIGFYWLMKNKNPSGDRIQFSIFDNW